jgi:SAM-dependent methyltransferase
MHHETTVDTKAHWDKMYAEKAPNAVSWYRPHLDTSLALMDHATKELSSSIIDIGGGESTLVDDLLQRRYGHVTVLDVSRKAIEVSQQRLGSAAAQVRWINADITKVELESGAYDLWHDRAVFHFLREEEHKTAYVRQLLRAVKPGGHVIIATFGPEGPTKCSGLDVVRYDAESLHAEFGPRFRLSEHLLEQHRTPFGTTQQFLYCCFQTAQDVAQGPVTKR